LPRRRRGRSILAHHLDNLNRGEAIVSFTEPNTEEEGFLMAARIVQLNFKFGVSAAEYAGAVKPMAEDFAAVPGLRWKVWLMNEKESEAGGIYLFDDQASIDAFLKSDLAQGVMNHPALSEFSAKQFDVMEDLTQVTRGPLKASVTAA